MRRPSPDACAAARAVIEGTRVEGPEELDLEALAMMFEAHVEWQPLTNEAAHVRRIDDLLVIGLAESSRATKEWRFNLAHEIGHLAQHSPDHAVTCPSVALSQGDESRAERGKYWKTEKEASDFAALVTFWPPFFDPMLPASGKSPFSLDELAMIAERFDMPLSATGIRCTERLGRRVACAMVLSEQGRVRWTAASDAFSGKLGTRGDRLADGVLAQVLGEDGGRVDGVVDGVVWGNRFIKGMREWSLKARGSDVVLTWLWHPR